MTIDGAFAPAKHGADYIDVSVDAEAPYLGETATVELLPADGSPRGARLARPSLDPNATRTRSE